MQRKRTVDVQSSKKFEALILSESTLTALSLSGFHHPSPVQMQAIPQGRLGTDLIVQAKSGTGKTLTFSIIVMERLKMEVAAPQALILAPTREIAIQSEQVIAKISSSLPDDKRPSSAVFVGGLNIVTDEKKLRRLVHIVIGTPGRISSLLQNGTLVPSKLSMFILDEADVLLSENFYTDVTWIYDQLPRRKQVMAFSATYNDELLSDLEPLMKKPHRIMLCSETVSLEGVKQFYSLVGTSSMSDSKDKADQEEQVFTEKVDKLIELLSSLSFHQAAVFCNKKPRAEWLASRLTDAGFPSAYLSSERAQEERMQAMDHVREFKLRVIVSTDVMARGVDLDRVNVVVNLDLPRDSATYVHRVGRTGRFGSLGVSVTYITGEELPVLESFLEESHAGEVVPLPSVIPSDMYSFELASEWEEKALEDLKTAPKAEAAPLPPPPLYKKAPKAAPTELPPKSSGQAQHQTAYSYYSPPYPWSSSYMNGYYPPNPNPYERPHDPFVMYQKAYDWYLSQQQATTRLQDQTQELNHQQGEQDEGEEEEEDLPASEDLDGHAADLIAGLDIKLPASSAGPSKAKASHASPFSPHPQPHASFYPPNHPFSPDPDPHPWGHHPPPHHHMPPYHHHHFPAYGSPPPHYPPHYPPYDGPYPHPHPHPYYQSGYHHDQPREEMKEFFLQEWKRYKYEHEVWVKAWTSWRCDYEKWEKEEEEVDVTL